MNLQDFKDKAKVTPFDSGRTKGHHYHYKYYSISIGQSFDYKGRVENNDYHNCWDMTRKGDARYITRDTFLSIIDNLN